MHIDNLDAILAKHKVQRVIQQLKYEGGRHWNSTTFKNTKSSPTCAIYNNLNIGFRPKFPIIKF